MPIQYTLSSGMQKIADAIMRQEGVTSPQSATAGLNNPGNLMYAGQAGAVPRKVYGSNGNLLGTFASFRTWEDGMAALYRQIQLDANRGDTLSTFTRDYAPSGHGGNQPGVYADNMASWLGVDTDARLIDIIEGRAGQQAAQPASLPREQAPQAPLVDIWGEPLAQSSYPDFPGYVSEGEENDWQQPDVVGPAISLSNPYIVGGLLLAVAGAVILFRGD